MAESVRTSICSKQSRNNVNFDLTNLYTNTLNHGILLTTVDVTQAQRRVKYTERATEDSTLGPKIILGH